MALYCHLPVWKAALDLAVHLEHSVRRFGKTPSPLRNHKYTLGSELRQTAQRLCFKSTGISHQVVSQSGHFKTGFKQRSLSALWLGGAPVNTAFSCPNRTHNHREPEP